MKRIVGPLLLAILVSTACAQVTFEKGYFVNNNGDRTQCLIKNKDWLNNPDYFDYKVTDTDQIQRATVQDVAEFRIEGYPKYIRAVVKIDTSHQEQGSMSTSRSPEWMTRALFLKVLVDAKIALYYYETGGQFKFFYRKPADSTIEQLVYKEYSMSALTYGKNYQFRQQLFNDVKCGNTPESYFTRISYDMGELKKCFISYNKCMGNTIEESAIANANTPARDFLSLKVTPGLSYSSLSVVNDLSNSFNVKFDKELFFRMGLEIEFIFPFNKNKWSFFIEPTYTNVKAHKNYRPSSDAILQYQIIELPIGLRHYFFLDENTRFFLNAIFLPATVKNISHSQIVYEWGYSQKSTLDIKPRSSFGIGGGVTKGPFSVEARYYLPQDLLGNYISFISSYNRLTVIAGFRFARFKSKVTH